MQEMDDKVRRGVLAYFDFLSWQKYLVVCFLIYLAGFYVAPSGEFQLRWFYYTVTVVAGFMLIFRARAIFATDHQGELKRFCLISFLLFLPFLWTPDTDYLHTLRVGVERWLFVFSLALAVFYGASRSDLLGKWVPRLLILCAGIALLLLFIKALKTGKYYNLTGMMVLSSNPNQTGMPMGAACTLCLSLWMSGKLTWQRSLFWLSFAVLFALAVYITTTRSAMLGLLVVFFVLLSIRTRHRWLLLLPVGLVVGGVVYVFTTSPDPLHYLLSGRLLIWEHIWDTFKANPWFGRGATDTYAVIRWPSTGAKLEAHSLYFGLAYYAGIFGLLVFGWLMWLVRARVRKLPAQLFWVYFPLLVYGLIVSLFEGVYLIYHPHPFWLFTWLPIMALLFSQTETKKTEAGNYHGV